MRQQITELVTLIRLRGGGAIQRRGHGMQQGQTFGRQLRCPLRHGGDALRAEQLDQQAGAGGIQCAQPVQLHRAVLIELRAHAHDGVAQRVVVRQRPVACDAQVRGPGRGMQLQRAGRR
ncbi:hypothetical protein D3C77_476850 [compost metagenome]